MIALAARADSVRRHGIFWLLGALFVLPAVFLDDFRTAENLGNVLKQSAVLGIVAIGQTFVIICGLIDLSVGMLAGLVVVLTCDLMNGDPARAGAAAGLALLVGAGVGLVNGVLNNRLRVHSLILTFGMLSVLQGVIFVYTDRSIGLAAPQIRWLANGSVWGVPASALLLLAVGVAAHLVLDRTRFGHHAYAVGGNEENARRAGIDVRRVKLIAFILSGLSAGAGGLLLAGRLNTGYPNAGAGLELEAIVAVVLGGTTLAGGRGSIAGTVAAVLVLGLAGNVLNLLEISSFVQMLVQGLIVIFAILVHQPERRVAA